MNRPQRKFEEVIIDYLPAGAEDEVIRLWREHPYYLKITRNRKSKKGDFRPNFEGRPPAISINNNLNPYEFLLVLIHEFAHLRVWDLYGRSAKAHGTEWKEQFRLYMSPFFNLVDFPPTLSLAMKNYLINPKAASGSDIRLQKAFAEHDPPSQNIHVEDLEENTLFVFDNRVFVRKEKLRVRYLCQEVATKRKYRFSPLAPVDLYKGG